MNKQELILKSALAKSAASGQRLINDGGLDVTYDTLKSMIAVYGNGDGLSKATTITTATGLVAYDLEAPSKNLYPVLTPLRNQITRVNKPSGAGTQANWKVVSAITGGGISSMPWVPEGQRAAYMSITTSDETASYVTLGEESDVTSEAVNAALGFEDVLASTGMRMLQSLMIKEEYALLGGNRSVALGTPATPTVTVINVGGTVPDATYNVAVVALTLEGFIAASLASGVIQTQLVTGADAKTYTLNGGSSDNSATASTGAISATDANIITANVTAIKGAVAYAWYVGTAAAEKLEAITTINSVSISALLGTGQALSAITADRSRNAVYAFDGLLYSAYNSSDAYYVALPTGVDGVGTVLTATGSGGIVQIDTMLQAMWDEFRLGPEEIYVSGQQLKDITTKAMTGSGAPLMRYVSDVNPQTPAVTAGQVVGWYLNPYTVQGGQRIPIRLHPNLPSGTLMAWAQNLPASYQANNVPLTAVVQTRSDYHQIDWAQTTRSKEVGVYTEEVLKVQAPFAIATINNIAAG